jgi:DNA-binding transcriptional regulator LsrR (DeoR family)
VSKLRYEEGLRQDKIVVRQNPSRPKVSQLLQQVCDNGIVRTTIFEPARIFTDLETKLRSDIDFRKLWLWKHTSQNREPLYPVKKEGGYLDDGRSEYFADIRDRQKL